MNIVLPYPPKELNPNKKMHYAKKAQYFKSYRNTCFYLAKKALGSYKSVIPDSGKIMLKITFFPPDNRKRDDDNMISAFKAGRDGLALAMKIDDNVFLTDPRQGPVFKGGKIEVEI